MSRLIPATELEKITRDRLQSWAIRLLENSATPMLLIGVGHNDRLGQVDVILPDDLPIEDVRKIISFLYEQIVVLRKPSSPPPPKKPNPPTIVVLREDQIVAKDKRGQR